MDYENKFSLVNKFDHGLFLKNIESLNNVVASTIKLKFEVLDSLASYTRKQKRQLPASESKKVELTANVSEICIKIFKSFVVEQKISFIELQKFLIIHVFVFCLYEFTKRQQENFKYSENSQISCLQRFMLQNTYQSFERMYNMLLNLSVNSLLGLYSVVHQYVGSVHFFFFHNTAYTDIYKVLMLYKFQLEDLKLFNSMKSYFQNINYKISPYFASYLVHSNKIFLELYNELHDKSVKSVLQFIKYCLSISSENSQQNTRLSSSLNVSNKNLKSDCCLLDKDECDFVIYYMLLAKLLVFSVFNLKNIDESYLYTIKGFKSCFIYVEDLYTTILAKYDNLMFSVQASNRVIELIVWLSIFFAIDYIILIDAVHHLTFLKLTVKKVLSKMASGIFKGHEQDFFLDHLYVKDNLNNELYSQAMQVYLEVAAHLPNLDLKIAAEIACLEPRL